MIDPKLFTVEALLAAMFDDMHGNVDVWRKHAEIVVGYMPPFPSSTTKPTCVVRYGKSFLRGGFDAKPFWDCYGDDMHKPEWALMALLRAPVPPWLLKREAWAPLSNTAEAKETNG